MKKQLLFAFGAAAIVATPGLAATRVASSADLTSGPAARTYSNVDYNKYETRTTTRTYDADDGNVLYYTAPSSRSQLYKEYGATSGSKTVRTSRSETVRTTLKRKYYLAHPFYQPLGGYFGSVTDFSYNSSSYGMKLTPYDGVSLSETDGDWDAKMFSIKEDFSYGITDRLALMGMLRYDAADYQFKWKDGSKDKESDKDLNMFGLGAQWRFVDNTEWIATLSGYFEHQKDVANDFILELKAGYKVARSTIYGLARGWYVSFDEDAYGNGVSSDDPARTLFVAYRVDDKAFYAEGGVGVFSVLDEDWTLNLEAILGNYDWHNQASIKGAIGWQPNDWFALNLYAKTSFYDSADGKKLKMYWYQADVPGLDTGLTNIGKTKLDDYNEWSVGLQVIFQF